MDPVRAVIASGVVGANDPPKPAPSPQRTSLEPERFELWIRAPIAIKKLEPILSPGEAKIEIHRRLIGGEVLSIARTANWFKSGGELESNHCVSVHGLTVEIEAAISIPNFCFPPIADTQGPVRLPDLAKQL
jgi:hypothetical protein